MNLKDKINNDLKLAMKESNKLKLSTIRSIRASIIEFEKKGRDAKLTDEEGLNLLTRAAKRRKESIEQFEKANRMDLAEKEKEELKIIQSYLPKQLTEEEIKEIVHKIGENVGAYSKEDFPKLMPAVMKELKGKADGKIVREIVTSYLS